MPDLNFYFNFNSQRVKRQNTATNNLFVEFLAVVDNSVYNHFVRIYGNLESSVISQYIKDYFGVLIDGVRNLIVEKLINLYFLIIL